MSLFTRRFVQTDPPHNLITPNPRLATLRILRLIFLSIVVYYLLLIVSCPIFSAIATSGSIWVPWQISPLPFIFLLNVVFFTFLIQYMKRLEPLRFAAAQGDRRLLADEQPQQDSDRLQVPMKITTYPGSFPHSLSIVYLLFVTLLLAAYSYFVTFFFGASFLTSWFWPPLIAVISILLTIAIFYLISRFKRRPIEVTQEGIRSRDDNNKLIFIYWHEVRLFACFPEPGPFPNSPILYYELSSSSHIVSWTWTRRQSPFNVLTGPFMPLGEHNAQMRALCSLIAAKTDLPLYDLGKGSKDTG